MTRCRVDAHTGTSSTPHAEANIARDLRTGAVVCRGAVFVAAIHPAGARCCSVQLPRARCASPRRAPPLPVLTYASSARSTSSPAAAISPVASMQGSDFNPVPGTTLRVNSLTQDIVGSLDTGLAGIRWADLGGSGPINIVSNTGSFAIRASRGGMILQDSDGKAVALDHTGNIFAGSLELSPSCCRCLEQRSRARCRSA